MEDAFKSRLFKLYEQACEERDPARLMELLRQINELFDSKINDPQRKAASAS